MPSVDAQNQPEDLSEVKAMLLKIRGKMPVYGVRNRLTGELIRVFPTGYTGDARRVLTVGEDMKAKLRTLESLESEDYHKVQIKYRNYPGKSADASFIVEGDHPSYAALRSRRIHK
jgi:hypothetical protein